jgi:hypothetical protein
MSVAPGRAVGFSIDLLSNGVPVAHKPLTASFTTTEPGDRTEGTVTAKIWPVQPAPDGEPQWQVNVDAGPHGSFPLDLVWPNSPPIRWEGIRDIPKTEVAMNGGAQLGLIEGSQEPTAGYPQKARWEARLQLVVKPPGPVVEFAPAMRQVIETNQLERP